MRKLIHTKANALQEIYDLTLELNERLPRIADMAEYESILSLLDARQAKMDEVNGMDKRMRFLEESGYTPPREGDREVIERERATVRALLEKIQALDIENTALILRYRDQISGELKDIKDGQKSINAYAMPPEEEEGQTFDTRK